MPFLLKILGTLIGLSTVMLTCSLVVMCLVRVIQFLANSRGKTLGEMLGSLNKGFRFDGGDIAQPSDAAQIAFVHDILTYPGLHESSKLATLTPDTAGPEQLQRRRAKVASQVEYLAKKDLLAIVRAMLEEGPAEHSPGALVPNRNANPDGESDPDDERCLPARWSAKLSPERRKFRVFRQYVDHWYKTLEGAATERFKIQSRLLTASVSCLLVVFLNLDGLQLATEIFESPSTQELLATQAAIVLQRAQDSGASDRAPSPPTDRDALIQGVPETLSQMNGVLNEPSLHFGWQNSKIVKSWCACKDQKVACGDRQVTLPTIRWIIGLLFSGLLLSLGAPFWTDMLRNLLNLQNSVQQAVDPTVRRRRAAGKGDSSDDA